MTPNEFDYLRQLLKDRSGLAIGTDKKYLVESRLLPVARKAGVDSLSTLISRLRSRNAEELIVEVVEAMATNETFFFRDKAPYTHFREVIVPALLAARATSRRLRIWCAACSTGQESYSLAMALMEMGDRLSGWKFDIVATDLSSEVLERAKTGIYSQFEVQRGLPIQLLIKYFTQVGEMWQISPVIRSMVRHQQFNLLDDFSRLGRFDAIFCRNALIYFDRDTKARVLERIARVAEPDGFLVLGAAETVIGLSEAWKPVAPHYGLYAPAKPDFGGRLHPDGKAGVHRFAVVGGSQI